MNEIIKIENLAKNYGKVRALDGFKMNVERGKIHGFLGPNGSGKSTAIRIILGLHKKTSGNVLLFNSDPWSEAKKLHANLAYVSGDVNFWPNLTGGEIIDLLAELRGGIKQDRRLDLLKKFELDPSKKFRTYSKGNRQKVALIAALASEVELYIFDEPTSGLDPLMEQKFQDELRELRNSGKTVLLSSHILSEVENLCDEITIIREGKNVGNYSISELKKQHDSLEKLFLSKYENDEKTASKTAEISRKKEEK